MKIEMTDDQVDEVMLFELQRHSALLKSNISDLKRKRKRKKHEQDDLERFEEVRASMKILIGYYSTPVAEHRV